MRREMNCMKKNWHLVHYAVAVICLLLTAYSVDLLDNMTADTVLQALMRTVRNVIHISLLTAWCITLQRRIINVQVRHRLVAVSILMAFWLTAKVIKYEFIASRYFWLGRYIWYSYYIPMILIPLMGFFIIDHIGKPEGYRNPRWMNFLYIPAFAILAGIFTNDLHQLTFTFPEGIEMFDSTYGYGPIYFAAMAWFVLLGIYFVVMLLKKSRVPGRKEMQKLPALIMGGAVIFWILYCLGVFRSVDLTVVDCLIISLLLESAIQSGLIPSNTNYQNLFRASTVAAQVVDLDYQVCFASSSAMHLSAEEMKRIGMQPVKAGNTVLHAKPVKAGFVLWLDDVTELNEMMEQLQNVQLQLGKENELLQNELKLKEQQTQLEEKKRIYDRIAEDMAPKLKKMEQLLEEASDLETSRGAMTGMCVIGSYLKRRSNLLLLSEECPTIPAREMEYCLWESLQNLQMGDVYTMLDAKCEGSLRMEHVIAAYDFYEDVVERLLDKMNAMAVHVSCSQQTLKMILQIGCTDLISEDTLNGLNLAFGMFRYEIQEEDIILNLEFEEGGACG